MNQRSLLETISDQKVSKKVKQCIGQRLLGGIWFNIKQKHKTSSKSGIVGEWHTLTIKQMWRFSRREAVLYVNATCAATRIQSGPDMAQH